MNKQLKKNTRKQANQKKLKTRTKVIVRRLPPNLPEDIFYDSISEWLENITWKSYFPGKLSKRLLDFFFFIKSLLKENLMKSI